MPDLPEHLRKQLSECDFVFPAPPPGGGYLVLHPAQIANADLMAAIRYIYPGTKIIESKPLPQEK